MINIPRIMTAKENKMTVRALERIANSLEIIVDKKKKTLRMVDVERGKVYKTHLGGKLSK